MYFSVVGAVSCYLTKSNASTDEDFQIICAITLSIQLSFGYSISGGIILGFPVQERENKLKYALNVMGCRIVPYWLSTMIFDFILGSIVTTIMIIVLASLNVTVMLSFGKIIIFYSTQIAFIGISYSVSWLYTSANMAQKTGFFVLISGFFLFPMLIILIKPTSGVYLLMSLWSPIAAMS